MVLTLISNEFTNLDYDEWWQDFPNNPVKLSNGKFVVASFGSSAKQFAIIDPENPTAAIVSTWFTSPYLGIEFNEQVVFKSLYNDGFWAVSAATLTGGNPTTIVYQKFDNNGVALTPLENRPVTSFLPAGYSHFNFYNIDGDSNFYEYEQSGINYLVFAGIITDITNANPQKIGVMKLRPAFLIDYLISYADYNTFFWTYPRDGGLRFALFYNDSQGLRGFTANTTFGAIENPDGYIYNSPQQFGFITGAVSANEYRWIANNVTVPFTDLLAYVSNAVITSVPQPLSGTAQVTWYDAVNTFIISTYTMPDATQIIALNVNSSTFFIQQFNSAGVLLGSVTTPANIIPFAVSTKASAANEFYVFAGEPGDFIKILTYRTTPIEVNRTTYITDINFIVTQDCQPCAPILVDTSESA